MTALTISVSSAHDVVVKNDRGGIVDEYVAKYKEVDQRGDRIIIDGYCGSACTLALALPFTCVTSRAKLVFHTVHDLEWWSWPHRRRISVDGNEFFMAQYPPGVQRWVATHGGLTEKLIVLKGNSLFALVRRCSR